MLGFSSEQEMFHCNMMPSKQFSDISGKERKKYPHVMLRVYASKNQRDCGQGKKIDFVLTLPVCRFS